MAWRSAALAAIALLVIALAPASASAKEIVVSPDGRFVPTPSWTSEYDYSSALFGLRRDPGSGALSLVGRYRKKALCWRCRPTVARCTRQSGCGLQVRPARR